MIDWLKIFNSFNFKIPNKIINCACKLSVKNYENKSAGQQHNYHHSYTYQNLNANVTDKYIVRNVDNFGGLDVLNDNTCLPLIYVDDYCLQTIGTALPDF